MRKAIVFSIEALLVLLSSAALLYSMDGEAYGPSFSPWRAKLLAEDFAEAFAGQNIAGKASVDETISLAERLGAGCVEVEHLSEKKAFGCGRGTVSANAVTAHRTIFDGNEFSEVIVRVRYA